MTILIIACSLSPTSKSRALAQELQRHMPCEIVDMREYPLDFCDGGTAYSNEHVPTLSEKIKSADGVVLAMPVYNYNINAVTKNLIELTGEAWNDKVVGFIMAAGGSRSYMAPMSFANSLMLDFRCLINPRFVYACAQDFENGKISSDVKERIEELAKAMVKLTKAVCTLD